MNSTIILFSTNSLPEVLDTLQAKNISGTPILISENVSQHQQAPITTITAKQFTPDQQDTYIVVLNGEPSARSYPVIKKLIGNTPNFQGSYMVVAIHDGSMDILDHRPHVEPNERQRLLDDWSF